MASFVWTGGGGRCGSGSPAGVPLRLRLRQRGGAAMRRTFEVRRETSEQPDGQARWDRAYQLVFGWAATPVAAAKCSGTEVRSRIPRRCGRQPLLPVGKTLHEQGEVGSGELPLEGLGRLLVAALEGT